MTKRATKRVWVFSLWCYQRQETFVNLALFQTTTNSLSSLPSCTLMAFHSIIFPKLLVLSLKSTCQTLWNASKAFLFTTKHECHLTMYRYWRQFDFYACLTKNKSSSELRKAIQRCKNKHKNSLSFKVFPGSQPGRCYPLPTDFDLESRPSPAFFAVVCW